MRTILPLALLAATAACYTPRAVDSAPDVYAYDDAYGPAPLEASIFYDEYSGYAWFDVSRPAHVAVFALRPGGGLEIIYPAIGMGLGRQTHFSSGRHSVRTAGAPYRMTGNWSMAYGMDPMYIILVASDDPLDTRSFQATRSMNWLNRSSITYSPYVAMEALVGEVVPRPSTSAWTTAMHVVWPTSSWPRTQQRRYLPVRCKSGIVVMAPMEAVLQGYPICPEDLQQQEPPADSAKSKTLIAEINPRPGDPPAGWMSARIDDADLRGELRRIREIHGKRDPGILEIRPFPGVPSERSRPGVTDNAWGSRSRGDDSPRARPSRPVTPPTPSARPAPPPTQPSRPAPSSSPKRPEKPAKPGGGGGS